MGFISNPGSTNLSGLTIDQDLNMGAHNITLGAGQTVDGEDVNVDLLDKTTYDPAGHDIVENTKLLCSASDTLLESNDTPVPVVDPTAITKAVEETVPSAFDTAQGFRVSFEAKRSNGSLAAYVYWYLSGAGQGGSENINAAADTYQTFTQDIASVDAGDTLECHVQIAAGTSTITVRNFRIKGTVVKKTTSVWA